MSARSQKQEEGTLTGLKMPASGDGIASRAHVLIALLDAMICSPSPGPVALPHRAVFLAASRLLTSFVVQDPDARGALPGLTAKACALATQALAAGGKSAAPLFASLAAVASAALRETAAGASPRAAAFSVRAPAARAALYRLSSALAAAAGAACSARLAPWALAAARAELYAQGIAGTSGDSTRQSRKRPRENAPDGLELKEGSMEALAEAEAMEALGSQRAREDADAQHAALGMLRTVLEVGGAAVAQDVRWEADATVAHCGASAFAALEARRALGGWAGCQGLGEESLCAHT